VSTEVYFSIHQVLIEHSTRKGDDLEREKEKDENHKVSILFSSQKKSSSSSSRSRQTTSLKIVQDADECGWPQAEHKESCTQLFGCSGE
jgi:hypothetical protein